MKTKTILPFAILMAATSALAETRVSIGIHFGQGYGYYPPPPPPVYVYEPPCPGPGYVWMPGYWYSAGPRYSWRAGYWAPPRYRDGYRGNSYVYYDSPKGRHGQKIKYRRDDDRRWGRMSERRIYRNGRR